MAFLKATALKGCKSIIVSFYDQHVLSSYGRSYIRSVSKIVKFLLLISITEILSADSDFPPQSINNRKD